MSQTFFIRGPLPGKNDYAGRASRWHYNKLKKQWQAIIVSDINRARLTPVKKANLVFTWQESSKRRDPDNFMDFQKFVFDALVTAGILPDDGQDEVLGVTHLWRIDPTNPGVLVTVEKV